MGRRRRWRISLLATLTLIGVGVVAALLRGAPRRAQPFNVLLISVDTLRADHVGLYGYPRPTTPHIDRLGSQGIVFTQAICQNTNTNPSHASILSGLYPRTHGNLDNFYLMADEVLLAPEVFRQAGYRTAAFLSGYTLKEKICGLDQGFDVYDDQFSGKERRGDQTLERSLDWLRGKARERFFLFVHFFDPHGPYDPPQVGGLPSFTPASPEEEVPLERIPRYQQLPPGAPENEVWTDLQRYKARYDAEIAFADLQVGRLLSALEELDLTRRTVILLTSDHGEALDERYHLLDHGGGIGDEEIRVPLILKLPEGRLSGGRYDGQVESVDIIPTLASAAGLRYPAPTQGIDLLPLVRDKAPAPHPTALTETRVIPFRWRDRGYELSRSDTLKAVRRQDAKLVIFPGVKRSYFELYDLLHDPKEKTDIYLREPDVAKALFDDLERFLALPARANAVARPGTDSETCEIFRTLGYVDSNCDAP